MLRRVAGLVMLGLGLWLAWGALEAILAFTSRGGDVASALFEPPTGIIRTVSTALMSLGGLMVLLNTRFSGTVSAMAASGADSGLWMDEVLFGLGAIGLSLLILTLRRA